MYVPYRMSRPSKKPGVAAHTRTSLLRTLSAGGDWVLPETKSMLHRQFSSKCKYCRCMKLCIKGIDRMQYRSKVYAMSTGIYESMQIAGEQENVVIVIDLIVPIKNFEV